MKATWNRTLWAAAALLCYLAGGITLLLVVGPLLVGVGPGLAALTGAHYVALLASVGLFFAGGYAIRRVRRPADLDESPLPSQFQRGPGPSRPNPDAAPEVSSESTDSGVVRCPNCGAENDRNFTFCQDCSSQLRE